MTDVLIGRRRESEALQSALLRLVDGHGGVVVIEGEAGLGKTALVTQMLGFAHDLGLRYLVAGASDSSSVAPFELVIDLIEGADVQQTTRLRELRASPPTSAPPGLAPPGASSQPLVAAATEALLNVPEPTVLVLEDLHWADAGSLTVIRAALPALRHEPVLLVATCRPQSGGNPLRLLVDSVADTALVLSLAPLDRDAVREVAASVMGRTPDTGALEALDPAGGNPLLVLELLRGLLAGGDADPPGSLGEAVARRRRALSPEADKMLVAAAVLGTHFDTRALSAVLGRSAVDLTAALIECREAELLVEDGPELRFHHELLRDAIYCDIPANHRGALHREAGVALAGAGAPAPIVAEQLRRGAWHRDEMAAEWMCRAGIELAPSDPDRALELLDEAATLADPHSTTAHRARTARIAPLAHSGRLREALVTARVQQASAIDDNDRFARTEELAGLLMLANRADDAVDVLDDEAGSVLDDIRRARLLAAASLARMSIADAIGAARTAERASAEAGVHGDALSLSLAMSVSSRIRTFDHHYPEGLELAREAVAIADLDTNRVAHRWVPNFFAGLTELDLDDLAAATCTVERGRRESEEIKSSWALPLYTGLEAAIHFRGGDLARASTEAESGLALGEETGSLQAAAWCGAIIGLAALIDGDPDLAGSHLDRAQESWLRHGALLGADLVLLGVALVAELHGDPETALAGLAEAFDGFGALGLASCQPILAADLVRVACASGDRDRAASAVAALESSLAESPVTAHFALLQRCRGILLADPVLIDDAVTTYRTTPRRVDLALALADASTAYAATGQHTAAAARRDEAIAVLGAAGSTDPSVLLDPRTPEVGGDLRPDARPNTGWGSLTPAEREVALMVGAGLTNAGIARQRHSSRRTVEAQLRRVYAKLHLTSRTQLAIAAASRQ